jgi:hypothetical protein
MSIKDKLSKRIEENYKTKDSKSFTDYNKIFDLPKELKFFKPYNDKINQIIILPYTVKTENDPKVKKDEETYILEYFKHVGIGINNESILCMKKTFGKPCPICEEITNLQENYEANKEVIRSIKASKRGIYNIIDLNDTENPNEVKIFDSSFAFFEEEMLEEVIDPETKEYVCFPDTSEDGYIVKFRATEESFGKIKFNKYKAFRFEKRKYAIKKEILEKVLSLDEFLVIPTYEEVKNIFLGTEETEKPKNEEYLEKANEVPKQETSKNQCTYNHKFAIDTDTTNDCIDCKEWEKCSEENEKRRG